MTVSNPRLAAQLVGPGEEPRFFDDIGCLAGALRREPRPDLTAFVADHRTGAWVPARSAVYTRVERLETPMASHLIAHADEASRRADPDAANGVPVTYADVFGASEDGRDR
jgi:copper chaperone NosL